MLRFQIASAAAGGQNMLLPQLLSTQKVKARSDLCMHV